MTKKTDGLECSQSGRSTFASEAEANRVLTVLNTYDRLARDALRRRFEGLSDKELLSKMTAADIAAANVSRLSSAIIDAVQENRAGHAAALTLECAVHILTAGIGDARLLLASTATGYRVRQGGAKARAARADEVAILYQEIRATFADFRQSPEKRSWKLEEIQKAVATEQGVGLRTVQRALRVTK